MKFWNIKARYQKTNGKFFTMLHHCLEFTEDYALNFFFTRIYPDDMKAFFKKEENILIKVEIAESISWSEDLFNLLVLQTLKSDNKEELKYKTMFSRDILIENIKFKNIEREENIVEIKESFDWNLLYKNAEKEIERCAREIFDTESGKDFINEIKIKIGESCKNDSGIIDEEKIKNLFEKSNYYLELGLKERQEKIKKFVEFINSGESCL